MQPMINLVATRQKAGQPAELLRWYNDHVNLLMGFEDLTAATLYRCTSVDQTAAPEYVCLYDFPGHDAFAAFEASQAKERARQVTETGWGKLGIEIIQRTQYNTGGKWTGRKLASTPGSSGSSFYIQCLNMTPSAAMPPRETDDLNRWMADSLYVAATQANVDRYEWYVSGGQNSAGQPDTAQVIVVASSGSASAKFDGSWSAWWSKPANGQLGQAPQQIQVAWQAGYERVSAWQR